MLSLSKKYLAILSLIYHHQDCVGTSYVSRIVKIAWDSRWQGLSHENDDGIDGIIILSKKSTITGGIIHVQVKCGRSYLQSSKDNQYLKIKLGETYIQKHKPRWGKYNDPVVLIYVDPSKSEEHPKAWWVNLKDEHIYSKSNKGIILIPKINSFNRHTKGDFLLLSRVRSLSIDIPIINVKLEDVALFKLSGSFKAQARKFYQSWQKSNTLERTNPQLGEVIVNRIGWKHITRPGRKPERIIQSWTLLGIAKKIITTISNSHRLGRAKIKEFDSFENNPLFTHEKCIKVDDFIGLRARVNFPHRDSSLIQVVLKRRRLYSIEGDDLKQQKIWFYSIYEKRLEYK